MVVYRYGREPSVCKARGFTRNASKIVISFLVVLLVLGLWMRDF